MISLGRPGNQTRVILMAVGLGCFFVLGVRAVQANLLAQINRQVGENSPDFVLIDIQSDQVEGAEEDRRAVSCARPARITPLMRGRVASVDGSRTKLPDREAVVSADGDSHASSA